MERTTAAAAAAAANSIDNNDFRDIAPQWFERLNKILKENDHDNEDIIHKLYSEINDYRRCIVGEAYGYDESYVIQGTERYCQECTRISGNFSYMLRRRRHNDKLEDIIDKFTKHWNEKHREILLLSKT
jgi:hypothetical protein